MSDDRIISRYRSGVAREPRPNECLRFRRAGERTISPWRGSAHREAR